MRFTGIWLPPYFTQMHSVSTSAPLGSAATGTQEQSGGILGEVLGIDVIKGGEIGKVGHEHGGLDYVVEGHAAALKHGLDVGEHLTGLTLNAALGNGAGLGYQRYLSGQEYQVAAVDGVGIGAYRSGRFLGKYDFFS